MIICIAGAIASGKSTLSEALGAALNAKTLGFGDYIREQAHAAGISSTDRKQLQDLGQRLVEDDAQSFAERVLDWAEHQPQLSLVLDGVRHLQVWRAIQQRASIEAVWLVFIQVDADERRRRARGRGLDSQDLTEMESHPSERDIPELEIAADLVLDGRSPVHSLVGQVRSRIGSGP